VGSDTAGSVRIPAALCGVAGLMGPGLPIDGIRPLAPSLDTAGLLAQTAEDLAIAWEELSATAPGAGTDDLLARPPARIGVVRAEALGLIDRDVAHQVDEALSRLRNSGAELVPIDVPDFTEFARVRAVVIGAEALAVQRAAGAWPQRAEEFGGAVRMELARAESIDDDALQRARAEQRKLAARLRAPLEQVDALAWPTTPQVAPRADDGLPAVTADRRLAGVLTRLCGPVNAAGLAAVTVPCGLGDGGLPVGLQLVAVDERRALGAALTYERVGPAIGRPDVGERISSGPTDPDSER
jgi:aspartyl-tRNA(Asn)/glutamyl-tRNA(Gln) amidotransferase subunit A